MSGALIHRIRTHNYALPLIICLFFLMTVILPTGSMLTKIDWSKIGSYVSTNLFRESLINSLIVSSISTVITLILATLMAFCVHRTRIKFRYGFSILFTLPMLIPSISIGIGMINLFGDNGIVSKLTGLVPGIYGPLGIILGSVLYCIPVAFLMIGDVLKYTDYGPYEAAKILGISPFKQFLSITLPGLRGTLISACFAVFTLCFTDYGVPLAVGGRFSTLPVYLYRDVIGLLDFSKGAFVGTILLLPAVVAFIIDLARSREQTTNFVKTAFRVSKSKLRDTLAFVFSCLNALFLVLFVGSFVVMSVITKYPIDMSFTLEHIQGVFNRGLLSYFGNSLFIALMTAIFGTVLTYLTAFFTARIESKVVGKVAHLISMLSLAIPGIVLGLSYVILFNGTPIYGTFIILIMVCIIHFFANPYLMAYNAFQKFNRNFEIVGKTLGISSFKIMLRVFIPSTLSTIIKMASYYFMNTMITVSAVAFLFNAMTKPLSMFIADFTGQMMYEAAAVVSIIIFLTNVIVRASSALTAKMLKKKGIG